MADTPRDEDSPESLKKRVLWFMFYVVFAGGVYLATSWLLPWLEEARREPIPRIRVSPPLEPHQSHPQRRTDLDRG
jgi:hypothetical protein